MTSGQFIPTDDADPRGCPQQKARRVRNVAPENAWYRLLGLPILIALATGIAPYATGAPLSRSIGVSLTFGIVAWLLVKSMTLGGPLWPDPPDNGAEWGRTPRQWDVPGLQSALDRPQYMSRRILVQLHHLADELLARRSLSVDSAQARELLGDRTISLLTDPETPLASRTELIGIIELLTRLAVDDTGRSRALPIPPELVVGPRRRRSVFGRSSKSMSASTRTTSPQDFDSGPNRRETR